MFKASSVAEPSAERKEQSRMHLEDNDHNHGTVVRWLFMGVLLVLWAVLTDDHRLRFSVLDLRCFANRALVHAHPETMSLCQPCRGCRAQPLAFPS